MKYVIRKAQVRVKPYQRRGKMVLGYVRERPEGYGIDEKGQFPVVGTIRIVAVPMGKPGVLKERKYGEFGEYSQAEIFKEKVYEFDVIEKPDPIHQGNTIQFYVSKNDMAYSISGKSLHLLGKFDRKSAKVVDRKSARKIANVHRVNINRALGYVRETPEGYGIDEIEKLRQQAFLSSSAATSADTAFRDYQMRGKGEGRTKEEKQESFRIKIGDLSRNKRETADAAIQANKAWRMATISQVREPSFEYARVHGADLPQGEEREEQPTETMPGYEEFAEEQIAAVGEGPGDARAKIKAKIKPGTKTPKEKTPQKTNGTGVSRSGLEEKVKALGQESSKESHFYKRGSEWLGRDKIYTQMAGNLTAKREFKKKALQAVLNNVPEENISVRKVTAYSGDKKQLWTVYGERVMVSNKVSDNNMLRLIVLPEGMAPEQRIGQTNWRLEDQQRVRENQSKYGSDQDYEKWLDQQEMLGRVQREIEPEKPRPFPRKATIHQVAKDYVVSKKEAERIIKEKLGKSISLEDLLKAAQDYKAKWDTIKTILRGKITSGELNNEPRAIAGERAKLEAMLPEDLSKLGGARPVETKHEPMKGPTGEEATVKTHARQRRTGKIEMVREHQRKIVHNSDGTVTLTVVSTKQEQPPDGNIPDVKVEGVATAEPQPQIEPTPKEKTPQKTIEFGWGKRKVHHDVGGRIGGAKKEAWVSVHLENLAQLEAEGVQEAYKHVNKDKVFGDFDIEADKNSGSSAGATFLKAKLLTNVASRPPDSSEMREAYVKAAEWMQEMFATKKTVKDIKEWLDEFEMISGGGNYRLDKTVPIAEWEAIEGERHAYSGKVTDDSRLKVLYPDADRSAFIHNYNPFLTKKTDTVVMIFRPSEDSTYANYRKALGKKFDEGVLSRRSQVWRTAVYTARGHEENGDWSWMKTTKERAQELLTQARESIEKLKAQGNMTPEREKEIAAQLADIEIRMKATEENEKKAKRERKTWRRDVEEKVSRVGGDPTPEATTAAHLKDSFNLKAVEYGNWISDEDAAYHISQSWTALSDLADVLGISKSEVSMNGRLSLAIGARGTGSAKAHYEPGKKVINLTKFNGGGSVAHEMGHMFDNVIAEVAAGERGQTAFCSHLTKDIHSALPKEVQDAVVNVMRAIKVGGAYAVAANQKKIDELTARQTKLHPEYYRMSWGKPGSEESKQKEVKRQEFNAVIKELNDANKRKRAGVPSDFLRSSWALGGSWLNAAFTSRSYWSRSEELFARAFEGYIEDKLNDNMKRKNSYLVSGTKAHYPFLLTESGFDAQPYPQGEERQRIHASMDKFVDTIKSSGMMRKAMQLLHDILSKAEMAGLVSKKVPVKGKTKTFMATRHVREGEAPYGTSEMTMEELISKIKTIAPKDRPESPYFQEYEKRGLNRMGASFKPEPEPVKDIGGYEQILSPASRAKAVSQMNEQHIVGGIPKTRKQYIEDEVSHGATVGEREGQRALIKPDGSYMRQKDITKTAIDYAEHLISKQTKPVAKAMMLILDLYGIKKAFPGQGGFRMAKQQEGAAEKAEEKKEHESGEPPSQAAERLKRYAKEHREEAGE